MARFWGDLPAAKPLVLSTADADAIRAGTKRSHCTPITREKDPEPGSQWRECLCAEIDPSDAPCLVCEVRYPAPAYVYGDYLYLREPCGIATGAVSDDRKAVVRYGAANNLAGAVIPEGYAFKSMQTLSTPIPAIHMPYWAAVTFVQVLFVGTRAVQDAAVDHETYWRRAYPDHWQRNGPVWFYAFGEPLRIDHNSTKLVPYKETP